MSLERYTISSRRLSAALLGAVALTAGGVSLAASRPAAAPVPTASPRPVAQASAEPAVPAAPRAMETAEPAASPGPDSAVIAADGTPASADDAGDVTAGPSAVESEIDAQRAQAEVVEAQQVAADFAVGYASYHYDDPPGATAERVRPYVTADLYAALSEESGGNAGRAQLAEREQTAEAQVSSVQTQTVADGWMDLLVVLRQTVTTVAGTETRWPSYLLRVQRTDDGWRVGGFQP